MPNSTKQIIKLTLKDISELPLEVRRRLTSKHIYCLKLNGVKYYGFRTAKQIHQGLKPQKHAESIKYIYDEENRRLYSGSNNQVRS